MLKKIAVLLIVLCLVVGIGIQAKATNTDFNLDDLLNNSLTNGDATNTQQNETLNVITNTEGNGIIQPDTNNESTSGNNLPQTGVTEDMTVMFFIIICAIVSIYAYKKIRDYKA